MESGYLIVFWVLSCFNVKIIEISFWDYFMQGEGSLYKEDKTNKQNIPG